MAKPKVAVAPIDGDVEGTLTRIVSEVAAASASVAEADEVAHAMRASGMSAVSSATAKRLRTRLHVDVLIAGRVRNDHLTLTVSGAALTSELELEVESRKQLRKELATKLRKRIEAASDADAGRDEDGSGRRDKDGDRRSDDDGGDAVFAKHGKPSEDGRRSKDEDAVRRGKRERDTRDDGRRTRDDDGRRARDDDGRRARDDERRPQDGRRTRNDDDRRTGSDGRRALDDDGRRALDDDGRRSRDDGRRGVRRSGDRNGGDDGRLRDDDGIRREKHASDNDVRRGKPATDDDIRRGKRADDRTRDDDRRTRDDDTRRGKRADDDRRTRDDDARRGKLADDERRARDDDTRRGKRVSDDDTRRGKLASDDDTRRGKLADDDEARRGKLASDDDTRRGKLASDDDARRGKPASDDNTRAAARQDGKGDDETSGDRRSNDDDTAAGHSHDGVDETHRSRKGAGGSSHGKRVAGEDGESRDEDDADRRGEGTHRHRLTQAALWADAGAGLAHRSLVYTGGGAMPPPHVGTAAPSLHLSGELYPAAFSTLKGTAAGLGIAAAIDRTVGLGIAVPDTTVVAPIRQGHYEIGVRYRYTFGTSSVAAGVSYWGRYFIADRSGLTMPDDLDMPDVAYRAVAPGAVGRFAISPQLALFGSVEIPFTLSVGQISKPTSYGGAKVIAFAVRGGAQYALSARYAAEVALDVDQVGISFAGQNGSLSDTRSITAATDRTIGLSAMIGITY